MNNWMIFHRLIRKMTVLADHNFVMPIIDDDKNTVFVFGVSSQINFGDLAISYAQEQFCNKYLNEFNYVEILDYQNTSGIEAVKENIRVGDVIFVSGGGNVGNLYMFSEVNRRDVIEAFPDNLIVSFPQSYFFTNDSSGSEELGNSKKIYEKNCNFVLTARESLSRDKMENNFRNRVIFCPDIVLSLNESKTQNQTSRRGILGVMRNDEEKIGKINEYKELFTSLDEIGKIQFSDNNIGIPRIVKRKDRKNILKRRFDQFNRSKLVITDRLHGMLFSVITGTPCIVFNNSNSKVKYSYLNWLTAQKNVLFVTDQTVDELVEWAKQSVSKEYSVQDRHEMYSDLLDVIKNGVSVEK